MAPDAKPVHYIDGQEEGVIPIYPPPKKVMEGKPYIESMEHYKREWEESVGPNSDAWWAKVSAESILRGVKDHAPVRELFSCERSEHYL
jgi:hypothetical protein